MSNLLMNLRFGMNFPPRKHCIIGGLIVLVWVATGCSPAVDRDYWSLAEVQIQAVVQAIRQYQHTYPTKTLNQSHDGLVLNREVAAVLTATGPAALLDERNPDRERFLDVGPRGLADGLLIDPWGNALNIVLDSNRLAALLGEKAAHPGVPAVWSNGPNGINENGQGDDVASWKPRR